MGGTSVLDEEEDAAEACVLMLGAGPLAGVAAGAGNAAPGAPMVGAGCCGDNGAGACCGPATIVAALSLFKAFPKNPPAVAAALPTASPTAAAAAAPRSLTRGAVVTGDAAGAPAPVPEVEAAVPAAPVAGSAERNPARE